MYYFCPVFYLYQKILFQISDIIIEKSAQSIVNYYLLHCNKSNKNILIVINRSSNHSPLNFHFSSTWRSGRRCGLLYILFCLALSISRPAGGKGYLPLTPAHVLLCPFEFWSTPRISWCLGNLRGKRDFFVPIGREVGGGCMCNIRGNARILNHPGNPGASRARVLIGLHETRARAALAPTCAGISISGSTVELLVPFGQVWSRRPRGSCLRLWAV